MKIRIVNFKGAIPKIHPRLLPESYATRAVDARFESGSIKPWKNTGQVYDFHSSPFPPSSPAVSFFQTATGEWLSWPTKVNAASGPVATKRTYYTGDGVPKLKTGNGNPATTTRNLRLDAPVTSLTATPIGTADPDTSSAVLFTYTYLTDLGEESQPALASAEVVIDPTQVVTLSGYPDAAAVAMLNRGINRLKFYISQTDSLGNTTFFLIRQVNVSALGPSWNYNPANYPMAEPITSTDYDPPDDGLQGLISAPGGLMAAFVGKDLYFCEPYIPHAWPIKYSLTVDYDIVGLASIGSSIAVLTTGQPYVAQGFTPDAMTLQKIEQNMPCVSADGIVDLGYAVAYPSHDGLVLMSNSSVSVVTDNLFTPQQWRDLNPDTIVGTQYQGRYIFSCLPTGATVRVSYMIDLSGEQPYLINISQPFSAAFYKVGDGICYLMDADGYIVRRFDKPDSSSYEHYEWDSRVIWLSAPTNFGAILVETVGDPHDLLAVEVWADDVLRRAINLQDKQNQIQRLPSGFTATRWQIKIRNATAEVSSISLATTPSELSVP